MKKNLFLTLIFLTLIFNFGIGSTQAQENIQAYPFLITMSPEYPGPNQNVNIEMKSYAIDLLNSEITWYINDIEVASGYNLNSINLKTGTLGEPIKLSIRSSGDKIITRSFTIIPQELDVLWETNSYTPSSYQGKKLPSNESLVKVLARPYFLDLNKNIISKNDLVYVWSLNNKTIFSKSGVNKDLFQFKKSQNEDLVSVKVMSKNKNLIAQKNIRIKTYAPEIIYYTYSPLEGFNYENSLKENSLLEGEIITLTAEPFFIPSDKLKNPHIWKINNKIIQTASTQPHIINLDTQNIDSQQIKISTQINNLKERLNKTLELIINNTSF